MGEKGRKKGERGRKSRGKGRGKGGEKSGIIKRIKREKLEGEIKKKKYLFIPKILSS